MMAKCPSAGHNMFPIALFLHLPLKLVSEPKRLVMFSLCLPFVVMEGMILLLVERHKFRNYDPETTEIDLSNYLKPMLKN